MARILFLFDGKNIQDKTIWSGTVSRLYNTLKTENYIIPVCVSNKKIDFVYKTIRKILKLFHIKSEFKLYYKLKSKIVTKKILKIDYDYIFAPALSGILAFLQIDKPIIYLTDATHHLLNNYYYHKNKCDMRILNDIEHNALNVSTIIITSSNWAKNDMVNFYKISPQKIYFMPFYTTLSDQYKLKKLRITGRYEFLFVGVDWDRKGVEKAIECVTYLNNFYNINCHLNIIGLTNINKVDDKYCTFYGFLNKNNENDQNLIEMCYKSADIFILPTIAECAGIVFAEAAMYGLPALTHDTGGVSDYVIDNYTGFTLPLTSTYIDFANKFKYLLDYNLLETFSKNARKKYETDFTSSTWLQKYNHTLKDRGLI